MIKKTFLLASLIMIGLSSCKKDRTCVCTQNGTDLGTYSYTKISRKDGRNLCSANQAQLQTSYPGATCSLR